MIVERRQAVVVGSGLAGLTAALTLAPLETLVLTKTEEIIGGSTPWAQGGVAFPRDAEDVEIHIRDTLISGAGHGSRSAVEALVTRATEARRWLEAQGIVFDHNESGGYEYGQEGAHSVRRILHVGGVGSGAGLTACLTRRAAEATTIELRTSSFAVRLLPGGLLTFEKERGLVLILSPRMILAGGGLGQLFEATTAPAEATGDTIALAFEAGGEVLDLEMVQYHPTALALREPGSPQLSLLTEALRGEGARLVTVDDRNEQKELDTGHPLGALGPRDVLSRAIFRRLTAGFPVWLDARSVPDSNTRFPTVTGLCARVSLNPVRDLLPISPAVHYTMGGVVVDLDGATSLPGVWAVGEASRTGVHGANRLASNSLLECVVWGRAAGLAAASVSEVSSGAESRSGVEAWAEGLSAWRLPSADFAGELRARVQKVMGESAGPIRDKAGLIKGIQTLDHFQGLWDKAASGGGRLGELTFGEARTILETRNLLLLGPAVLNQALARTQSLGAHFRGDA